MGEFGVGTIMVTYLSRECLFGSNKPGPAGMCGEQEGLSGQKVTRNDMELLRGLKRSAVPPH